LGAARGDALRFVGVEADVVVVEFDPFVPFHGAQAEVDVVFWAVAEGAVGERRGVGGGPVWVWRCCGAFEVAGFPGCVVLWSVSKVNESAMENWTHCQVVFRSGSCVLRRMSLVFSRDQEIAGVMR
jgi:hypothetical protein